MRTKTARLLGKGKGRKGKHREEVEARDVVVGSYYCSICKCQTGHWEEWISHVQGRRHQTNHLIHPDWRDPYGGVCLSPQAAALMEGKRRQLEPIKTYCEHFKHLVKKDNQVSLARPVLQRYPPPPLCPGNAYVQATPGVGSVNFRTVDLGGAFFNWSHCALCVLSDSWVLGFMMFIFCVQGADWGMMGVTRGAGCTCCSVLVCTSRRTVTVRTDEPCLCLA